MTTDLSLLHLWSWSHLLDLSWPTWKTAFDHCWILFRLPTKQTVLCPATPRQTWELQKNRICRLKLGLQYHHAWPSLRQTDTAVCAHFHLSVDHQFPARQAAASEAGQTHIQNSHHKHWRPSGLRSLLIALLALHKWLHFKGPLCQKLLKFADDTTVIFLIKDGDESAYRQEVEQLAVWCSLNKLKLNTLKTVEIIVNFRRNPLQSPHSPSWTALWLKLSHSDSWEPPSLRTWSGKIALTLLQKRPSRGCISSAS